MAAKSKSPENTENNDESTDLPIEDTVEVSDESSDVEPVLIEGEALDVDENATSESTSDNDDESFPPEMAQVEAPKRASIWPMFLGGLVAVGIGFGGAFYWFQDQFQALNGIDANASEISRLTAQIDEVGASIPTVPPPVDTSGIETNIAAIQESVTAISDDVDALKDAPPVDLSGLTADLQALTDRIAELEIEDGNAQSAQADEAAKQLVAFKAELDQIVSAAEAKVSAAEAKIASVESKAAEADAAAAEAAKKAATLAQIAELKSAIEGGATYDDLISGLDNIPADLIKHAETGVPTLNVLQQEFPNVARSALNAVQSVPQDASAGEKLTAFLRRQTNARSLVPKEGDGADAVLSRAEALLARGDLDAALSEATALPEEAQNVMSGWIAKAQIRQSALQSIKTLSAEMN